MNKHSQDYRIAIIGSGPAGFFAAASLLKSQHNPQVYMFERLIPPYGLVRYGVAPDHPKIKSITAVFQKTAQHQNFTYCGNVEAGSDIKFDEILQNFHQVLICCGARSERRLNILGHEMIMPASHFVGWYNGHPDFEELAFDERIQSVGIIGVGNVAMDIARTFLKPKADLQQTDMAAHALDKLTKHTVSEVHLFGRRGLVQAAFTNPELRQILDLDGVDVFIEPEELILSSSDQEWLNAQSDPRHRRNVELLDQYTKTHRYSAGHRRLHLWFKCSPVELLQDKDNAKTHLKIERNRLLYSDDGSCNTQGLQDYKTITLDLSLSSIGYKGIKLDGIPFDEQRGIIPNQHGRVDGMPRVFVSGWIKRGPSGVIGTNRQDANETVQNMLADMPSTQSLDLNNNCLELLKQRSINVVSFNDWLRIDAEERLRGAAEERPRVKFIHSSDMLKFLDKSNSS